MHDIEFIPATMPYQGIEQEPAPYTDPRIHRLRLTTLIACLLAIIFFLAFIFALVVG